MLANQESWCKHGGVPSSQGETYWSLTLESEDYISLPNMHGRKEVSGLLVEIQLGSRREVAFHAGRIDRECRLGVIAGRSGALDVVVPETVEERLDRRERALEPMCKGAWVSRGKIHIDGFACVHEQLAGENMEMSDSADVGVDLVG